jgi:hypothetical protein
MTDQALVDALKKIRAIIDQALTHKPGRARASKPEAKAPRAAASSKLPDHILGLRDSGFMKQPKTGDEVHAKLQPSYHCDVNRVEGAMLRLHKRRLLRKTSKIVGNRKKVAYVW